VLIESFLRLAKSRELERMSEIWSIHLLFRKQIFKSTEEKWSSVENCEGFLQHRLRNPFVFFSRLVLAFPRKQFLGC
jgi:hypothetical protein